MDTGSLFVYTKAMSDNIETALEEAKCCECGKRAYSIHTNYDFVNNKEPEYKAYCWEHCQNGAYQRNQQMVYRMAWDMNCHDTYWPYLSRGERDKRREVIRLMADRLGVEPPTFF